MERKLETIIDNYGYEKQSRKAIEELGELIVAINKNIDDPGNKEKFENLVEEIADVEIMLEQLKIIHDIEPNEILEVKKMKIERELQRIMKDNSFEEACKNFAESMNKVTEVAKGIKTNIISQSYKECDSTDFILEEEAKDEEELQRYMREQEKQEVIKIFTNFLEGYYGK